MTTTFHFIDPNIIATAETEKLTSLLSRDAVQSGEQFSTFRKIVRTKPSARADWTGRRRH